jgi:hypothetical protein
MIFMAFSPCCRTGFEVLDSEQGNRSHGTVCILAPVGKGYGGASLNLSEKSKLAYLQLTQNTFTETERPGDPRSLFRFWSGLACLVIPHTTILEADVANLRWLDPGVERHASLVGRGRFDDGQRFSFRTSCRTIVSAADHPCQTVPTLVGERLGPPRFHLCGIVTLPTARVPIPSCDILDLNFFA